MASQWDFCFGAIVKHHQIINLVSSVVLKVEKLFQVEDHIFAKLPTTKKSFSNERF
jgi:hypothetical protein